MGWGWALIWVWLGGRGGGRLFEAGRLLTFSAFRMGAYSRWALIRGWALIRINTVFARMLVLEWKRKSYYRNSELHMFLLISGGHILVHQNGAPIWRLHTNLYKGAWNVSTNNSETVGHKDLRLGQIVYILVFYNISFSWLLPLDGFQFTFSLSDSETIYTKQL